MQVRNILNEIIKHSLGLFETIKLTTNETSTIVRAVDEDKILFLRAILKPCPDLLGEFGITNLPILDGLLGFSSYRTENAKFNVKRDTKPRIGETVVAFNFYDQNGAGARFATMNPELIKANPTIPDINWEIEFVPSKSKITEFSKLVSLYKSINNTFVVKLIDKNLMFSLGENNDTTHSANVLFANDIEGKLSVDGMKYNCDLFLNVLRIANGIHPAKISISGRGPMCVSFDTDHGTYQYILRTADSENKKK